MMYARDHGILQSQITAARRLRNKGVRLLTSDHLKVELDYMLNTGSSVDSDVPLDVASLEIQPGLQRTSIEEHAMSTLDSLTDVMRRHPVSCSHTTSD